MLAQLTVASGRCLSSKDLEDLDTGNLSDTELDQVLEHLSSCANCATLLQKWHSSGQDELSNKLRKCFALEPLNRDPALSRLEKALLEQTGPILPRDRQPVISDTALLSKSLVGAQIGQNHIEAEIGRGGMGLVFRAWQKSVKRHVAIKVIRSGFYADPSAVARFQTEAGAIARLQHPNVAQLFDYSEHEGLPFFVMELVDGGSLEKMLRAEGRLPCRQAAELTRTIAASVEYAHQKHVIHRDLKPSNILMTRDGVPKIADFGLAKMLDEQGAETQTDMIMGTPSYMAPEQALGRKSEIGPVTDVYALGAILYESITGQPPFKGVDRLDTLRHVREEELTPPSRLRPDIPRDLEAICVKCLAKSPSRRYQTAQDFAEDLGLWLDDQRPKGIPGFFGRGLTKLRRNWIAASLGLACLIVALVLYIRDPNRPLRAMQAKLAKGEPVTMIGEKGMPVWFKWLSGEESGRAVLNEEGSLRLHAYDPIMLELLPSIDRDHYRFQVRILHEKSDLSGEVGIYFARQEMRVGDEPVHFYMQLSFNDIRGRRDMPFELKKPLPPISNYAQLIPRLRSKPNVPPDIDCALIGRSGPKFEPPGEGHTDWRDLAVDVSPEGVTAEWDGQTFHLSADEIKNAIDREFAYVKEHQQRQAGVYAKLSPAYSPRGGLGLIIHRGSASFRSVMVLPQ